jgi:catechol 2,3-dioxygenase-like lactoylglutathione lyase family enzyme
MTTDLFAGIPVTDYAAALPWYERLLGAPPAFFPTDKEAVWDLGERRWLYIVQRPQDAGHTVLTIFVDDLDAWVARAGERGIDATSDEDYEGGVRKMVYRDADGNEIGVGGSLDKA